ncbi:divergent polysaccharide deacetylase family protein [Beggiatoa alba]|nr:divergent polysaccharide deacetylase family protein [Beggiatoa alba]
MRFVATLISLCLCNIPFAYASNENDSDAVILQIIQNKILSEKAHKPQPRFYIGLIIDDMGYRYQSGKRAINLPANITFSFLPYAPHARKLANLANEKQKEIMLHIPMEANNGQKLGPGGLLSDMEKPAFELELKHNLSAIPFVKGVNNHMGSLLTQKIKPMTWLMQALAAKNYYFIDSLTSGKSTAMKAARQYGIPSEPRDVFVDHVLSNKVMQQQLRRALAVAKHNGSAVVIAHPLPETMRVLEKWLPDAKAQGAEFVYMSKLLAIRQQHRAQGKTHKRVSQWQIQTTQLRTKNN